ncbi:MAG: hypothetical protein IPL03_06265 [Sterolibacteriaceae bacterium]|nr:hypothetical protein [Candidatus Methylophosphatis haderslevensis]
MRRRLLVLLCAALLAPAAAAEEALGRLFFTPEKRAALERSRKLNLRQTQQIEGANLSLEGIVRRSDGNGTAWINGRPHNVSDPRHGVAIGLRPDAAGATVSVGDEAPSRLRVGETVNRGTREKSEPVGSGSIGIDRDVGR